MAATLDLMLELAGLLEEPDSVGRHAGTARLVAAATSALLGGVVTAAGGTTEVAVAEPSGAPAVAASAVVQQWFEGHRDLAAALMRQGDGSVGRSVSPAISGLLAGLAPFGVASLLVTPLPGSAPPGVLLAFFGPAEEQDDDTPQRMLETLARLSPSLLGDGRAAAGSRPGPVFDALPDAAEAYDGQGRLLQVNARHRGLFGNEHVRPGMTQPEVLEALGATLARPDQSAQAGPADDAAPLEMTVPGPELTALERVSAVWDGGADGAGSVALYRDVSRLKRMERQKDEFLSLASHELKTPLTTIKGYSQMLQRRLHNAAAAGADGVTIDLRRAALEADQIREEGDRLNRRVDQLLDVSRIQTGRLRLARKRLDLRVLLPEILERLRVALDGRELVYRSPRERTPLVVDADEERLRQIVGNLVENAARYSPPETAIEIRLRQAAPADGQPRRAVFSVRDHGLGIERADLDRIFDQYYRAARPAALQPLGLGLGLFIAREIVQQHGGRIWAESGGHGEGSTFSVELPLEDATAS